MSDLPTSLGVDAANAAVDEPPLDSVLAQATAHEARAFVSLVQDVAVGGAAETAIPLLLLGLSEILTTGARLGAIRDIVLDERFETDAGPEVDTDPIRNGIAALFEGLDEYADVVDPLTAAELTRGSLSNDLAEVVAALRHGLAHADAGRASEALWWWQCSYLADWGERAAMALRVVQSLLAHTRLDVDEELAAEALYST